MIGTGAESCLGFQQWRGLQDVYVDGVVGGTRGAEA